MNSGLFPGTGEVSDAGSAEGRGYTINVPVPHGSDEETWVSTLEHVIIPAAVEFAPQLVLISAGFDGHRDDPLGHCLLEASSYAQMACHVRDMATTLDAPVGAVLEGGYDPAALTESVMATIAALAGVGTARFDRAGSVRDLARRRPRRSLLDAVVRTATGVAAPSRDARRVCLIPCSILRSIMSEAGSIGTMPIRAASVGRRNRLRLISLVVPSCICEHERPDPVAILRAPGEHALGLDPLESHPV